MSAEMLVHLMSSIHANKQLWMETYIHYEQDELSLMVTA